MTGDELRLDAPAADQGARRIGDVGRSLTALRDGDGSALTSASAARPWGGDEAGRAFECRYRPVEAQVMAAWEQLAQYVEGLGDVVARAVHDDREADAAASRRMAQGRP